MMPFFGGGGGGSSLDASLFLAKTGGVMTGPLVLAADPAAALQAAPKQYVDANSIQHVEIHLDMPSEFVVLGSPAAYDGTITIELAEQAANMVFAGPVSGADAEPTFRALVSADISDLSTTLGDYLLLTGGSLTGSLDITGDLDITGGEYLLNGQSLIEQAQTPWLNNINADSKSLRNIRAIGGVKVSAPPTSVERAPVEIASNLTVTGPFGEVTEGNNEGLLLTYYPWIPGLPGQKYGVIRCGPPASLPIEPTRIPLHILGYDILLNCFYQGDAINAPLPGGNVYIGTDYTANLAQPGLPFKSTQWNVGIEDATNLTVGGSIVKFKAFLNLVGGPSSYVTFSDLSYGGVLAAIEGVSTGSGGAIKFHNNSATGNIMQERMCITGAGHVGIGNDANPTALGEPTLVVGPMTPSTVKGRVTVCGNTTAANTGVGMFSFANYAIVAPATEKRIALIAAVTEDAPGSGAIFFQTWNAGAGTGERMRITSDGYVGIGNAAVGPRDTLVGKLTIGSQTSNIIGAGRITLCNYATTLPWDHIGGINFVNFAVPGTGSEPRLAGIYAYTDGAINSARLSVWTSANGQWEERMRLTSAGDIGIGNDASVFPLSVATPHGLQCVVGRTAPHAMTGNTGATRLSVVGNTQLGGVICANLQFCNYAITAANKALAGINVITDGADYNSGHMLFVTKNGSTWAERMRITAAGNVGIGTETPNFMLDVNGGIRATQAINITGTNEAGIRFSTGSPFFHDYFLGTLSNGNFGLWDGNETAYAFQITPNRRFGINAAPQYILDINYVNSDDYGFRMNGPYGPITMDVSTSAGSGRHMLSLSRDSAAKPTTNTWTITSDVRAKRNVHSFDGGLDVIRKLEPEESEYNGRAGTPEGQSVVSLDPEKLREIVPGAVSSVRGKLNEEDAEETEILGVNTHLVFYHMLRAIQQLDQRLQKLEKA